MVSAEEVIVESTPSEGITEATQSESVTSSISSKDILIKALAPPLQEPYQISCAPQTLSTNLKEKYNAYIVSVSASKNSEQTITSSDYTRVFVLNGALAEAAQSTNKSFIGTVIGKGVSSVAAAIPGIFTLMLGADTQALNTTLIAMGGSTIPVVANGVQEYGSSRSAKQEAFYYDGIFRNLADTLSRAEIYAQDKKVARWKRPATTVNKQIYTQLPLFANIIVHKESNTGKPVVQVINSSGESWTYPLDCNNQIETSLELQKANVINQGLRQIINTPSP